MTNAVQPERVVDFVSSGKDELLIDHVQRPENNDDDPSGAKTDAIVQYITEFFRLFKVSLIRSLLIKTHLVGQILLPKARH